MTVESYNDLIEIVFTEMVLPQLGRGFDVKFDFSEYMKSKISKANKLISIIQKNKNTLSFLTASSCLISIADIEVLTSQLLYYFR